MGVLPYWEFSRDRGALQAFKSAYDEDTYLLGDSWTPYRFLSEGIVDVLGLVTPGLTGLMITTDVVIPILAVVAAWLLVTQLARGTGVRILCVLLLLFGQELFSLANAIVWPSRILVELRQLDPPMSLELFPEATTSYFNLFRTPEPAVSWVLLFGFLALVSDRDPLGAFQGRRRRLSYPIFAVLGFSYPFSSLPIIAITLVLLAWAYLYDRRRSLPVGMALITAAISYGLATIVGVIGDARSETMYLFASRTPIVTPALVAGALIATAFLVMCRSEVYRRPEIVIPFTAAVFPIAVANQQIMTGMMVSATGWERYTNYTLVMFALITLVARFGSRRRMAPALWRNLTVRFGPSIAAGVLAILLVNWQREVHDVWFRTNVEAHETARLLDGLARRRSEYPLVLENAGLTPFIRLLTEDRYSFVLDYTQLFVKPVLTFADGTPTDQAGSQRNELFEYAFRLGWTTTRLEHLLRSEVEGKMGGYYSHFVFSFADVWPTLTDNRALRTDEALRRLPVVTAAYGEYLTMRATAGPGPALVVTASEPADLGDGRNHRLVATASPSSDGPPLRLYVQTFDQSDAE